MTTRNFRQLLEQRWGKGCFVCVGLDTNRSQISEAVERYLVGDAMGDQGGLIAIFNQHIVDTTHDLVCAYKINSAFYERFGVEGMEALRRTIAYIQKRAPDVPVILDAKRADIENTNLGYTEAAFKHLCADAITVHPYLGQEALQPFLANKDKGIFVLCRTSNKGAGEFQDLLCEGMPVYQHVAKKVASSWNAENNNCGLVVGATYPTELRLIRALVDDLPILIPGIGAQGGNLEETVAAGKDSRGQGMIINSSRGIIFASSGEDFAKAARRETQKLHDSISQCLSS